MTKTPHEIATQLAAFYREFPQRWKRRIMGNMQEGCCMMGGAMEITECDISAASDFIVEFRRVTGWGVLPFNDCHAQHVNEIVDALDIVAAATKPKETKHANR